MPPLQTNPGSVTASDAAVPGLDLTIVMVREATDDALPEKNAAGLRFVSTRTVLSLLERYWRAFGEWRQRQNSRTSLHELNDRALTDIGVRRDEIGHIARHRAIDTLRDRIQSRGVM